MDCRATSSVRKYSRRIRMVYGVWSALAPDDVNGPHGPAGGRRIHVLAAFVSQTSMSCGRRFGHLCIFLHRRDIKCAPSERCSHGTLEPDVPTARVRDVIHALMNAELVTQRVPSASSRRCGGRRLRAARRPVLSVIQARVQTHALFCPDSRARPRVCRSSPPRGCTF